MTLNGLHHVGGVADFLGVSAPAATKNVDKLERLGLVARQPAVGDRRALLITVLPAGRRLVEDYERVKATRVDAMLASFAAEEVAVFSELLERFSVSLLERGSAEQTMCLRCSAYIKSGCPVGAVRGGCPYIRIRGHHVRLASGQASTGRSA